MPVNTPNKDKERSTVDAITDAEPKDGEKIEVKVEGTPVSDSTEKVLSIEGYLRSKGCNYRVVAPVATPGNPNPYAGGVFIVNPSNQAWRVKGVKPEDLKENNQAANDKALEAHYEAKEGRVADFLMGQ